MVIDFQVFTNFPIQRYKCKTTGATFSLLPSCLVPYQRFDLAFMLNTLDVFYQSDHQHYQNTCSAISLMGKDSDIPLEPFQIHNFQHIFQQAFTKLSTCPELARIVTKTQSHDPVKTILNISKKYRSPIKTIDTNCSAIQLAWDYYVHFQKQAWSQRHFMFGTPSHKRSCQP